MKNLFLLLFIPLFFFSCIEVEKEFEVGKELEVVIVEFGELSFIDDAKTYGNFEIQVPEIDQDVMENGAVFAFIERAATKERKGEEKSGGGPGRGSESWSLFLRVLKINSRTEDG